jgi:hypothetical protein
VAPGYNGFEFKLIVGTEIYLEVMAWVVQMNWLHGELRMRKMLLPEMNGL